MKNKNKLKEKKLKSGSLLSVVLSISLTIIFFLIILTLLICSRGLLVSNPTAEIKKITLGLFIASAILIIPFAVVFHLTIEEVKQFRKEKLSKKSKQ